MGLGISGYIEIERIFLKFQISSDDPVVEKGMLTPDQGHRFFQKVVDEGKIGWEIIFERFPQMEFGVKEGLLKVKLLYLGPMGEGTRAGSHPAYFKFQIAGRTILYQGKFYDLPETRRRKR